MYSLLIDTHSNELNLIIYKNEKIVDKICESSSNQSKWIILKLQELIKKVNISFNELKEIIVVNGPGSFTGVRIGVTIAKTISYILNIPIKSISAFQLGILNNDAKGNYSIAIPDNKGCYVGRFVNNDLIDTKYLSKADFEKYKETNTILESDTIDWNLLFQKVTLVKEDCFNIKPIYIKKIEVEK